MRSQPMVIQAMRLTFFGALIAGIGLATGALAAPVSADSFPVATDARLGGDETQTRFVVDLSRKIDLHVFTLPIHTASSSTSRRSRFGCCRKPARAVAA